METNLVIIISTAIAVTVALILTRSKSSKELRLTIKMEDEGYPIKDDGVEELEVKPKRKYKKRTSKPTVAKTTTIVKKPVGRPRKNVY